ncbi:MAG: PleD family two-component system response regulator [Calditrichaceae bacterium]
MTDILIIDDSEIQIKNIVRLFTSSGITSRALSDPTAAINSIINDPPKVIILDIMMPGIDGLTLLRKIKEIPEISGIPVIMLSGKNFPPEKKKAIGLGAETYLTKPVKNETLINEVSTFL